MSATQEFWRLGSVTLAMGLLAIMLYMYTVSVRRQNLLSGRNLLEKVKKCKSLEEFSIGTWIQQGDQIHVSRKFNSYKCLWQKNFPHFCHKRNASEMARVVDMLKWAWKPKSCILHSFNADEFVNKYLLSNGSSILFVGDSITQEHFVSLSCMLWDYIVDVENSLVYQASQASFMEVYQITTGARLLYIRDDYLVDTPEQEQARKTVPNFKSWREVVLSLQPSIIIMNTGAHGTFNNSDMSIVASDTLKFLHENFRGMLVYRETIDGHSKCDRFLGPSNTASGSEFNWNQFKHYNHVWRGKINELSKSSKGRRWLAMSAVPLNGRPDAHSMPPKDCLHTCLPGPIDVLNDFLYNIMDLVE